MCRLSGTQGRGQPEVCERADAVDSARPPTYSERVKIARTRKRAATTQEIVRLAKKTKWNDMPLPGGEVVAAETIREMFAYAEAGLRRRKRRRRLHVAAA